ncbi:MAG: uroporphyrinogen-III synthase [Aquificaceae bacterium]
MSLKGKRVAVCATRRALDITERIHQSGGRPFVEDIVRLEYLSQEEIRDRLLEALSLKPDFFLFTTGEGAERIFEVAQEYGAFDALRERILESYLLARGYKTRKALIKYGFRDFQTVENTEDFKEFLKPEGIKEKAVFLQMYGEDLPSLEDYILDNKGKLIKVWVYRYVSDIERVDAFIEKILKGFYHAVLFTSAFQVKHLFTRAKEKGLHREISKRMSEELITVAVGYTTAKALFENGVVRTLVPERERLMFALKELVRAFEDG